MSSGLTQRCELQILYAQSRYRSEQKSIKMSGKLDGHSYPGTPKKFQTTHIGYRAHRAVIFAIAWHLVCCLLRPISLTSLSFSFSVLCRSVGSFYATRQFVSREAQTSSILKLSILDSNLSYCITKADTDPSLCGLAVC